MTKASKIISSLIARGQNSRRRFPHHSWNQVCINLDLMMKTINQWPEKDSLSQFDYFPLNDT